MTLWRAIHCGQMNNPTPADCIVLGARALRAHGVTDRQLGVMLKENPARLLGFAATRHSGLIYTVSGDSQRQRIQWPSGSY